MKVEKREAARRLISWHFEAEPELREVYLVNFTDNPSTPIKLLEVNAATVSTGSVEAFGFAPTDEIPFSTLIAEITPDEFETFKQDLRKLPRGWALEGAERFERLKANER